LEQELIKQLSKYNKKELYQWLIVSMIHPSNQKFGIRYELLIHTLLAIEEDKFINEKLTKEKFEEFISWFEKEYSNHFVMMEDFEPFSQLKLIPLFLDKDKYYFFYGSLERPYEALKQFHEIVFSVDIEELNEIKSEFLFSLKQQTDILTELTCDKEAQLETDSMYIPTLDFFNKYKLFFEVKKININYLHNSHKLPPLTKVEKMYNFGIDTNTSNTNISQLDIDDIELEDSISFYEMGINNFNGLYTEIDNQFFIIPFESHIETIYNLTAKIIYDKKFQFLDIINYSMRQRMLKMLSYFFTPPHRLDGLMDMSKNIHSKYFDTLAQIDADKVVLFKFIPHLNNLQNFIDDIAQKSFEELKNMKSSDELFMFIFDREKQMINMNQIPVDMSEIKIIIIFEKLTLNYMLNFEEDWKEKNIFIYNSLDIKPILELLNEKKSNKNIALWQYLEAEKLQASHNNTPIQMDTLDSFSNYYENETFAIMGQQPDLMMFATHSWSDFYHEYLYKKYQDNIYELVEASFPNKFNRITHLGNDTYEYIDSSTLDGGKCVKYNNKLIWIAYPSNGFSLKEEELKVSMFITEFFSFYIDRYKESIFRFLKAFNFNILTQNLMIAIFPDTVVKQNENMKYLLSYANKINDNEPIKSENNSDSILSSLSIDEICNHLNNIFKETIPFEIIEKVLSFLSLNFKIYKSYKPLDYSIDKLMTKKERLNLSPFIKIKNKYLFGHQLLLNVIDGWIYSLIKGDVPFSINESSLVKKELNNIHNKLDKELEILAYNEAVKVVGENFVRMTINKFKMLSEKFPQKPTCGEIDLLIVNEKTKIIFVMDAKNVNKRFQVSAINRELNKFLKGEKSYLIKLTKKFDFIKENQDEILNHFKISDKSGWKVKKGFVVNRVHFSAFYKEKVDFVLIDNLGKYIQG